MAKRDKPTTQNIVRQALRQIRESEGTDHEAAVRDLLTELRHHCTEQGINFDERDEAAREVYEEELTE